MGSPAMPVHKRLGFLLVFVVPALMPCAAWLGSLSGRPGLMAWFPLFFLFVLLPLADYAIGLDRSNPADAGERAALEADPWFRWLTLACVPVQIALVAWSTAWFVDAGLGPGGRIGWVLSQGVVSGVLAINVAHELIHKAGHLEPAAGGVLLCTVGYFGFKVEHVRGHHVHVATPRDASSARLGETVYGFVVRALFRNTVNAWRLEAERLAQLALPAFHWRNELLGWALLWIAFGVGAWSIGGTGGLAFFGLQGLFAAISLEIINYIEHYGLERRLVDGRYERVSHHHSWNANYLLSNLLLFQLQRHSDHHAHARRRYQALLHHADSPQLPGGYAAMFVLALLPPLWRRVIDPRVRAHYAAPATAQGAS